jgi:WD40 repeat protein
MYSGGIQLLYPYDYGNIKKWNPANRTLLYTITFVGQRLGFTNDLAVSPDGSLFASGNGSIYCAPKGGCSNIAAGFHVFNADGSVSYVPGGFSGIVQGVSFSHDGNYVAMAQSATNDATPVHVYDMNTQQLVSSLPGHDGTFALRFSPRQRNLLATGGWDGLVNIWDIPTNRLRATLNHGDYINGGYPVSLAFSPKGDLLASAGDGYETTIKVWDVRTGLLLQTLTGSVYGNNHVAFSPNGQYIAAGINQYTGPLGWHGLIRIWRVSDGVLVREYLDNTALHEGVSSIAFSRLADNWFAYTYDDKIKFAETDLQFGRAQSFAFEDDPGAADERAVDDPTPLSSTSYPNPFNPTTTIRYSVPAPGHVSLRIFNVVGEQIAVLVNRESEAGEFQVHFDGTDLPSGVYFSHLQSGRLTEVKKLILAK